MFFAHVTWPKSDLVSVQDFRQIENCSETVVAAFREIASLATTGQPGIVTLMHCPALDVTVYIPVYCGLYVDCMMDILPR